MDRVEILLSKKKIILLFIGSVFFTVFSVLFIVYPNEFTFIIVRNPTIIRIVGIVGAIFFGIIGMSLLRKLNDKEPGLVIDANGITDNSNATSIGLINWEDIYSIEEQEVLGNKFLIINTVNPNKYLNRAKNKIARNAMILNNKRYGSPLTIVPSSLQIDFQELEKLLNSKLSEIKKTLSF